MSSFNRNSTHNFIYNNQNQKLISLPNIAPPPSTQATPSSNQRNTAIMASTPIRVGLIGLSASAKTAWASKAHLPYLLSPLGRSKYQIVALLNSSESAARAAIDAYSLPPSTRAYGDPAALAADPEVDLVVCATRVDKHYATVIDSVKAGKDVFVEWPLAENGVLARELAREVERTGARSVVGVQGVRAPVAVALKKLVEEGRIGKVVSSELRIFGGLNDRVGLPEGLAYFVERQVGGNIYTIGFAHSKLVVVLSSGIKADMCPDSFRHGPRRAGRTGLDKR